jgi:hypothetical protein
MMMLLTEIVPISEWTELENKVKKKQDWMFRYSIQMVFELQTIKSGSINYAPKLNPLMPGKRTFVQWLIVILQRWLLRVVKILSKNAMPV